MSLSDAQLDRYARHIVLKEIGGEGQRRLLAATVALVGAGGIGSPAIQYLAAAGVGALRVIDDDAVALDNLQRQILFGTADVGRPKTEVAGEAVARLNPDVALRGRGRAADAGQCRRAARRRRSGPRRQRQFRDPADRLRRLHRPRIPLVSAAIGQFQAQIGTFRGWEADKPCYRCFVGDAFDAEDCDTCSELGVLGAMAGIAGSFAALEAIRQIAGFGDDPAGKLHIFDGLAPAMRTSGSSRTRPAAPAVARDIDVHVLGRLGADHSRSAGGIGRVTSA